MVADPDYENQRLKSATNMLVCNCIVGFCELCNSLNVLIFCRHISIAFKMTDCYKVYLTQNLKHKKLKEKIESTFNFATKRQNIYIWCITF